ncbi:MAG TPA: serine O-acetyltransferase [Lysobacter sp.]|nr:serine O-acetyltransferase [Lysobacter sp.]
MPTGHQHPASTETAAANPGSAAPLDAAGAPAVGNEPAPGDDIRGLIRSDLYRYAGDCSRSSLTRHLLFNRSFKYSFWLRLCRSPSFPVRMLARVMHRHLSNRYGIQIPPSTRIGPGLFIGHHMGLVINHTATIGWNCNLGQFTTIGSNHEHAARIGNNVYIGPGVCVVEDVVIGDNATVGAGAVVVKDVPENSTVAGNPAKVVSTRHPGRYVCNRWPIAGQQTSRPG